MEAGAQRKTLDLCDPSSISPLSDLPQRMQVLMRDWEIQISLNDLTTLSVAAVCGGRKYSAVFRRTDNQSNEDPSSAAVATVAHPDTTEELVGSPIHASFLAFHLPFFPSGVLSFSSIKCIYSIFLFEDETQSYLILSWARLEMANGKGTRRSWWNRLRGGDIKNSARVFAPTLLSSH